MMRMMLAALAALFVMSASAHDIPAVKLVWMVETTNERGHIRAEVPETQPFASSAACQAFGEEMTPRMQDWVRGRLGAEWNHTVQIAFRCHGGQEM